MNIKLTRVEGPDPINHDHHLGTFAEANELLRKWSMTAPDGGGYDKCDFTITIPEINLVYDGRYDLKSWRVECANLRAHVVNNLEFMAGVSRPCHMDQERYDHMLDTIYKMTDESKAGALAVRDHLLTLK